MILEILLEIVKEMWRNVYGVGLSFGRINLKA